MSRNVRLFRLLFVLGCGILAVCETWAIFFRETPAVVIEGHHLRLADEFWKGRPVSQTFQMFGNGLTAVAVQFSSDRPAAVLVQCELSQIYPSPLRDTAPTRMWSSTRTRASVAEWRRIEFPPIDASNGRVYVLRLQLIAATPIDGPVPQPIREHAPESGPRVALVVSKDNVLGGGQLRIGDQRQVGSLSLRAFTRARTAYERFRADVAPALPPVMRDARVAVGLAMVYQWALLTVVFALLTGARSW